MTYLIDHQIDGDLFRAIVAKERRVRELYEAMFAAGDDDKDEEFDRLYDEWVVAKNDLDETKQARRDWREITA